LGAEGILPSGSFFFFFFFCCCCCCCYFYCYCRLNSRAS
jgi:hypothetical protein